MNFFDMDHYHALNIQRVRDWVSALSTSLITVRSSCLWRLVYQLNLGDRLRLWLSVGGTVISVSGVATERVTGRSR
jgi:hypothetical protein